MTDQKPGTGIPEMPAQPPASSSSPSVEETVVLESAGSQKSVRPGISWRKRRSSLTEAGRSKTVNPAAHEPTNKRPGVGEKKSRRKWLAALAVLVLLGAGVVVGTTLPDPRSSKEYQALQSEKDGVSNELDTLQARYDNLDAGIKDRESAVSDREGALDKQAAEVKAADAEVKAAADAVKKREDAVSGAEKKKEANTIREGTWTVGVDIAPGTYRANADITDSCYWGIYVTGSNKSDIVDNDIVTGGRPSVTLSAGQDFESKRCGSWSKQ
jgi:hypothetical protein